MLDLEVVDLVAVREHLGQVVEIERRVRTGRTAGKLQNPTEAVSHDGEPVGFRGGWRLGARAAAPPRW